MHNLRIKEELSCHLLNVGGDIVDLGAVLISHHHAFSGSGVSAEDNSILNTKSHHHLWNCSMSCSRLANPQAIFCGLRTSLIRHIRFKPAV